MNLRLKAGTIHNGFIQQTEALIEWAVKALLDYFIIHLIIKMKCLSSSYKLPATSVLKIIGHP